MNHRNINRTTARIGQSPVSIRGAIVKEAPNKAREEGVPTSGAEESPANQKLVPPSDETMGLLLMDSLLNVISWNDEALAILSYREPVEIARDSHNFLADLIQARLVNDQTSPRSCLGAELVSGKRHYRCRVFHLDRHVKGSVQPLVLLLLERSGSGRSLLSRAAQRYNFSRRGQQAVKLLVQGLSNNEIAAKMKISPNTVNTFFRMIMIRMGVSSRSGILAKMIRTSLDGPLLSPRTSAA